jgi:hypothetical protein
MVLIMQLLPELMLLQLEMEQLLSQQLLEELEKWLK